MFAGARVFITGGSSGIGKQIARDFLRRGAQVSIAAENAQTLEKARAELSSSAAPVRAYRCDVADLDQVKSVAAAYVRESGAPDILVNNAGYAVYRTVEEMTSEEIHRLINVNFVGACLFTREFLPAMIAARRGHILMVASIAGRVPMTPCGVYSASKHGMVAWAETLAAELDRYQIRVHVVCPARVETAFFAHESFVQRAPRQEAQWAIPIEKVSGAAIEAIAKGRFLTYVPRKLGPLVWLAHALPVLSRPMLQRLMRARVESVYAAKEHSHESIDERVT